MIAERQLKQMSDRSCQRAYWHSTLACFVLPICQSDQSVLNKGFQNLRLKLISQSFHSLQPMSNAPKVTFGNKSNTNYVNASQLASNIQKSPEKTVITQYYDRNTNPSAGLEYVSNQVVAGQPSQFVAPSPPPIYQYRPTSDPRVSGNAYSNQWTGAAPATVIQTSTVVKQPRINEEIERPQYSSIAQNSQPSKKLGPDQDPKVVESPLCRPCCWILGVLIGLALLALALLFGLGVIGGSNNNSSSSPSASVAVAPSTNSGKVASVAPIAVSPSSPHTNPSSNTAATTPTGTTSVSSIPYVPSRPATSTTTPTTTPTVHPGSIAPITVSPVAVKPTPVAPSTTYPNKRQEVFV